MRLAYYLEDNDLQREVMLEILHDIFHDAVSFVPFSCLDDLKQACIVGRQTNSRYDIHKHSVHLHGNVRRPALQIVLM